MRKPVTLNCTSPYFRNEISKSSLHSCHLPYAQSHLWHTDSAKKPSVQFKYQVSDRLLFKIANEVRQTAQSANNFPFDKIFVQSSSNSLQHRRFTISEILIEILSKQLLLEAISSQCGILVLSARRILDNEVKTWNEALSKSVNQLDLR